MTRLKLNQRALVDIVILVLQQSHMEFSSEDKPLRMLMTKYVYIRGFFDLCRDEASARGKPERAKQTNRHPSSARIRSFCA